MSKKRGISRRQFIGYAAGTVAAVALNDVGSVSANDTSGSPAATNQSAGSSGNRAWSFGVIADTQWTIKDAQGKYADDGYNPNTVAANIIKQVDQQFINAGVKLVVAVGDTVDWNSKSSIDTRALYAQDVYAGILRDAGIGFFPLRGNHEACEDPTYLDSGPEFRRAFPQIGTGTHNSTPADIASDLIPAVDLANNPPAAKRNKSFTVGTDFSEPTSVNRANKSVSYSFRYNGVTFMLLDQFDVNGNYYNSTIPQQQQWIDDTLAGRPANTHAFVFIHKNMLGGNHKDSMFGGNLVPKDAAAGKDPGDGSGMKTDKLTASELDALNAKQSAANKFVASMQANRVPYVISGHDHHHYVSLVTSPDGKSQVRQLITQSDSSKFYTPAAPFSANDTPIQQDLSRVGYYIFTVDGPRVTVDYYGDSTGGGNYGLNGGTFDFVKLSTISYSLNGKSRLVNQGASYEMKDDTSVAAKLEPGFRGTSMSILAGTNGSTAKTNYGKKTSKDVSTSWAPAEAELASDILGLAGLATAQGSDATDTYTLALSFTPGSASAPALADGGFGLLTRDASGKWVNAAASTGATASFVSGPWDPKYGLGTYGVDAATNTAWAVLNYQGTFAVGRAPSTSALVRVDPHLRTAATPIGLAKQADGTLAGSAAGSHTFYAFDCNGDGKVQTVNLTYTPGGPDLANAVFLKLYQNGNLLATGQSSAGGSPVRITATFAATSAERVLVQVSNYHPTTAISYTISH